jgi:hypothetical protein
VDVHTPTGPSVLGGHRGQPCRRGAGHRLSIAGGEPLDQLAQAANDVIATR